ncbi:HD domain-containing protein [Mycobacterium sp. NPDC050551]|uniref:HD domain-containing protein n=1 Tax=Mycobacterium sp. NPDC050551 TaxID=3155407 RepID=UPI00342D73EE
MTSRHDLPLTTRGAQWDLPDSDIASAAVELVFDVSPAFLANHCVRSFLFARELASTPDRRGEDGLDEETLFLACLLHDLGITDYGTGGQRFEVDGADAAARFLRDHGIAEDRTVTVWQSIALHTSLGLAQRFGHVQSLAFSGISLDIDGMDKSRLTAGFAERVHDAWPRDDLGYAIARAIDRGVQADPMKAPPFTFPAHVHELFNGRSLTFFDVVANSGWGDRPSQQ